MNQIKQSMIKAALELRALARDTNDPSLKRQLLEKADYLELASQEDPQNETRFAPSRLAMAPPRSIHSNHR